MVEISVVVCTWNRAASLRDTLLSLASQAAPRARFEVLVIDNGSTDATARVAAQFAERPPYARYVFEPRIGLSIARNRAIAEAQCEVLAFLDDDAVAAPSWLSALAAAFDTRSDVDAVAGRTNLEWPGGSRPVWLPDWAERYYAKCDFGSVGRLLRYPEMPVGANMAVSQRVFNEVGPFNELLGRTAGNLVSGEEEELFTRLESAGKRIWYEPEALVSHMVNAERASRRWLIRRAFRQGSSLATVHSLGYPASRPEPAMKGRTSILRRLRMSTPTGLAARLALRLGYRAGGNL